MYEIVGSKASVQAKYNTFMPPYTPAGGAPRSECVVYPKLSRTAVAVSRPVGRNWPLVSSASTAVVAHVIVSAMYANAYSFSPPGIAASSQAYSSAGDSGL